MKKIIKTDKKHYDKYHNIINNEKNLIEIINLVKNILEDSWFSNEDIINKILEKEENKYLNFIHISIWDKYANFINKKLSLSEKVSLLKHITLYKILWFEPNFENKK